MVATFRLRISWSSLPLNLSSHTQLLQSQDKYRQTHLEIFTRTIKASSLHIRAILRASLKVDMRGNNTNISLGILRDLQ